jgi:tetratricopeptide (TPR) repeat protein
VLVARLLRLGESYLLEVRAFDPASGTSHFSFKEQDRGKESLNGLLDRVGERARLLLGEEPAAIRQSTIPTNQVTDSLEAWRAYSSSLACFEKGSFAGTFGPCLADAEKAVAIDPGFALGHLQVAVLRFFAGKELALQQQAVRLAQAHVDRVPPHDRQRLAGWAAYLRGRDGEAKSLLVSAAAASPDDKLAWYLAGEVPYHRDEFAEALPLFKRVYALDPNWQDATQHLILTMGVAGDLEGVRAMAGELGAAGQGAGALAAACYARLWFDPDTAVSTCRRVRPAEASEATDGFVAIALLNLDHRDALHAHLDAMKKAWKGGAHSFAWYMRLWLLGQEGRWDDVERVARAEGDPDDAWLHSERAELFAGVGDAAGVGREALRILELNRSMASNLAVYLAYLGDLRRAAELERYLPPGSPRVEAYQALVQWRQGQLPDAIRVLRQLAAKAPISADPAIPPPLYLLGEALAEAGEDAQAVEVLGKFGRIPQTYPSWFVPRSQWLLARSLDRLGRRDEARQAVAPLLKLWTHASDQQPHLAEARALGQRTGAH